MWVRVFNLHFSDKMKSCRHKTYRHLILSWFQASVFELWVRVFNLHFSDKMKSCRHKRHDELVSPMGNLPEPEIAHRFC